MISISIDSIASKGLGKRSGSVTPALQKSLLVAASHAAGAISETLMQIGNEGSSKRGFATTGQLARSFHATNRVDLSGGVLSTGAYSAEKYARIQNEGSGYLTGGVVRPTKGKYLAIPIDMEAKKNRTWPSRWARPLVLLQSKGGNPYLAEVTKNKVRPIFLLRRSVVIKGSGYLERSAKLASKRIADSIRAEVRKAARGGK